MLHAEKTVIKEFIQNTRPLHLLGFKEDSNEQESSPSQDSLIHRLNEVNRKLKEFGRAPSLLWGSSLEKTGEA